GRLGEAEPWGPVQGMATLLRRFGPVETVFMGRMAAAFPDRITKIRNRILDVRGGAISEGAFFERHRGAGPYWPMIEQLFEVSRRKAGLSVLRDETLPATFRRPGFEQTALF